MNRVDRCWKCGRTQLRDTGVQHPNDPSKVRWACANCDWEAWGVPARKLPIRSMNPCGSVIVKMPDEPEPIPPASAPKPEPEQKYPPEPRKPYVVPIELIKNRICKSLGMPYEYMSGTGKGRVTVLARMMVTVAARRATEMSYPEIARTMGKTHPTALDAHNRIRKMMNLPVVIVLGEREWVPDAAMGLTVEQVVEAAIQPATP